MISLSYTETGIMKAGAMAEGRNPMERVKFENYHDVLILRQSGPIIQTGGKNSSLVCRRGETNCTQRLSIVG